MLHFRSAVMFRLILNLLKLIKKRFHYHVVKCNAKMSKLIIKEEEKGRRGDVIG